MTLLEDSRQIRTALSPLRRQLLAMLQEPSSASELGGRLGIPRQKVNYHLGLLEQAGLIRLVETRARRGCVERIMQASAKAFVVDPQLMGEGPNLRSRDRYASEHLIQAAAETVGDVSRLQAGAERAEKRLLTFTIEAEVGFAQPADVHRFTDALARAVASAAADCGVEQGGQLLSSRRRRPSGRRQRGRSTVNAANEEPAVIEVTVGAPVETVWASLRDHDLIKLWMGWHYDQLDAEIDLIFYTDAKVDADRHVLELGDGDRFEVYAGERGTVVRITRAPFVPDTEWSAYYHEITEGWLSFLQQLKFMHEEHPGEIRRTLFLSGTGTGALAALEESIPAESGESWYSAKLQHGTVLPRLGPGLLIMATKPPATDDQGNVTIGTMAIVTTYGLDDEAFDAERSRWENWWRSGYPESDPAQV